MFPNPQDALPLPPSPSLAQYRKLAKELVKACAAGPDAIDAWARAWLARLARAHAGGDRGVGLHRLARDLRDFATAQLTGGARTCVLADAQFVVARCHGFDSWPKLVAHIDALTHATHATAAFEAAADAIVAGDEDALRAILAAQPDLIGARSTREHRATLLHYVAANGVENYRQKTPRNAVRIARILLDAGAEVDAAAEVYRGKCTTLGLVATSVHPFVAGVQEPLLQLLIDHGADVNRVDLMGNRHSTVFGCLANGRPEAAAYLAARGARLGLVEAAGVGRLDVVRTCFDARGLRHGVTRADLDTALLYACQLGHADVAAFLLDRGADPKAHDGQRQTALHHAAIGGARAIIDLLIARGAPLEAVNAYGGTVLGQALWSAAHGGDPEVYASILQALIAAGARVPAVHPPVNGSVDAVLARHGSVTDPKRSWFGEEPEDPDRQRVGSP